MLHGSPRFVVSTAVILWVCLTAIPLDAQVSQPTRNPVAVPAAPEAPAALSAAGSDVFAAAPPSFTLSFEGGTVKAYVDLIAKQGDVNVVIDREVGESKMPALELKNVFAETALQLVPQLATPSVEGATISFDVLADAPSPVYVLKLRARAPTTRAVGMPMPVMAQPPRPEPELLVLSLNELIRPTLPAGEAAEPVRAETILTAIDAALGMPGGEGVRPPTIKFHQESGLLLVRGSIDQLSIAQQIVEQLTRYHAKRWEVEAKSRASNEKLSSAQAAMQALEAENAKLRNDAIRLDTELKQQAQLSEVRLRAMIDEREKALMMDAKRCESRVAELERALAEANEKAKEKEALRRMER
jgi:hypothetical protein